jgi:L-amino acid N-acyltransferase YncA
MVLATRWMQPGDWPAVARIYAEGIATGDATFETEVPSWEQWDSKGTRATSVITGSSLSGTGVGCENSVMCVRPPGCTRG